MSDITLSSEDKRILASLIQIETLGRIINSRDYIDGVIRALTKLLDSKKVDMDVTEGKAYRFRKKPVVIDAMLYDGEPVRTMEVYRWVESYVGSYDCNKVDSNGNKLPPPDSGVSIDAETGFMVIATLEGEMTVKLGDFVIRGVNGEFYPCKPDIFWKTYDRV